MCLRHCLNTGEIQLLPKQSYHICRREEDAKSILDPPLHIPPDEGSHFQGLHQGVWPLGDAVSSAWRDHGGRVCTGMPSSKYGQIRSAVGCVTPSGRPPSVFRCLLERSYRREGALRIYLAVALAIAAISSVSGATCRG